MKQALAFTLLLGLAIGLKARDFERNQGIQWAPFVEWTLENQTVDGNPFDLEAKVTFVHQETKRSKSGSQHIRSVGKTDHPSTRCRWYGALLGLGR